MPVEIGELVTNIHATDSTVALTPQAWEQIRLLIEKMIGEHETHAKQVRTEQRVTTGVSQELEEDLEN